MRDPSIIFPELWIAQCAINNPRDIIDEELIYNAPKIIEQNGGSIIAPILWIGSDRMNTIHNPRDIIDEESIHNVPKIMDRNGVSIMQGNYGWRTHL